jgi:hypothetical protein
MLVSGQIVGLAVTRPRTSPRVRRFAAFAQILAALYLHPRLWAKLRASDVGGDPSRLVAGEWLGTRPLVLGVDVSEGPVRYGRAR